MGPQDGRIRRVLRPGRALAVSCVLLGASCRERSEPQAATAPMDACARQPRLLVATAMEEELDPLLERAHSIHRFRRGGHDYVCALLGGRRVLFSITGVGPPAARRSIELSIAEASLEGIVFVGIAGGVAPTLRIGDVTIPDRWSFHDRGAARWRRVDQGWLSAARRHLPSLKSCDDREVCRATPLVWVGGAGVTGAAFVADPTHASRLSDSMKALVTDMETSAAAEAAQGAGLPFIAIRAVSDLIWTGRSDALIEEHGDLAAENAAVVTSALLAATPR